ncbi:hypothetical protein [[Mycobacterium] zoologicum]|uniref:hypothetical protein n=1 Tax=[Mycobacterium] zoologicum TaxID=2872311 RepID=UPI001CDACD64|nr:hypothetical protein [Mycolicibacter sp. MYC101]MEB3064370.1 hypothetical protein [Mycolicibacter sp. MYC101]
MFDAVRRHGDGEPPIASDGSKGMELAALMAVDAGELSTLSFAEAATNHRMEMQPWVRFADSFLPCPPWQVLYALERSLLAAADARLIVGRKEKVDKGELFERAAQACIVDAIGHGCRKITRGYGIKIDGTRDPGDVDVALVGDRVQILGEVKAMEVPDPRSAAASTFEKQVGEVYGQLHLRLCTLDSGIPLIDADGVQHYGADAIGLGVVLHPYSSSLGDPRMLTYVTGAADTTRIAVADLQSWVLLLHGLNGIEDLRRYLRFRDDMRRIEALSIEECDMALAYFSPFRDRELARLQEWYARHDPSLTVFAPMQAWVVDTEKALETKPPKAPRDWRRKFFRDCYPRQWV